MAVTLTHVRPGDEALLSRIAPDVFDDPVDPVHLAAYLAQPNHHLIVAVADGTIVGKCSAAIHHRPDKVPELYIDEIDVAASWRRQGIARQLLDAMFALGKEQGCAEAWVGTEADNEAARRLYEARGAAPTAIFMYEYEFEAPEAET